MSLGRHRVKVLSENPFGGSLFSSEETEGRFFFQSLGSGSSGNCSLLIYEGEALIIDAGLGIRTFLRRAETLLKSDLKPMGILITHDHGDHIKGAARLAHRLNVPIYATAQVCETLRYWSRDSKYDITAYLKVLVPEESFRVGHFEVTAFDVPHDATRNVGFSIKGAPGTFTLITDVGQVTDRVRQAIRESDYLIFESNYDEQMLLEGRYTFQLKERIKGGSGHLSNLKAATTISEEYHDALSFVGLCHLSGNNNTPALAMENLLSVLDSHDIEAMEAEGREAGGDALQVATIKRNIVSPLFRFG